MERAAHTHFGPRRPIVLLIVAGLFPVINPPAVGFIVLSLVPDATDIERADLARRIAMQHVCQPLAINPPQRLFAARAAST